VPEDLPLQLALRWKTRFFIEFILKTSVEQSAP